jgi:hypothetical protein
MIENCKYLLDEKYQCFEIIDNKCFCNLCKRKYGNKKKEKKFISEGAKIFDEITLHVHVNSKKHLFAKLLPQENNSSKKLNNKKNIHIKKENKLLQTEVLSQKKKEVKLHLQTVFQQNILTFQTQKNA